MPTYAEYQASDAYPSKTAGASVEVSIVDETRPQETLIGKTTGLTWNEAFEVLPVEEGGNDGVDEIVQGRHTVNCSVPAFFSPQFNDNMPTRQTFMGKKYTIIMRIAEPFPNAGRVLNVWTGAVLQDVSGQQGARGLMTVNMSFMAERRYNGTEWAALTGA